MTQKKRGKKSTILKFVEFAAAYSIIFIVRLLPLKASKLISGFLGGLLYFLSNKRRGIAVENLRHAFKGEKTDNEIKEIARKSCGSFFLTFMEIIKLRHLFKRSDAGTGFNPIENLDQFFIKAKKIHDESGGCIFVTPHIGNWEIFPYIASALEIPLAIVARPLDNEYLNKLIFQSRAQSGQVIIPKTNALLALQKTLQQGKSIGMLPDQSTKKGLLIDFFGRKATTTPVPALLSVSYKRPIVVVACCRRPGDYRYEGFISDPVWPGENANKKEEIIRITAEMTKKMEYIIRKYPEQYLWMHNRWKTYRNSKEFLA